MIRTKACYEITCDRDCDDKGWDDGTPHFESEAEAIGEARRAGFVIVAGRVLCASCARTADCEATGHQWGVWNDRESQGVRYRHRWCDHCSASDYDRPMAELSVLLEAARVVNGEAQR